MRWFASLLLLTSIAVFGQDAASFSKALEKGSPRAIDRWMKCELHRQRKGVRITSPGSSYTIHTPTYDSLTAWLRRQPGVVDAEWDRCIGKVDLWPGHSTIAIQVRIDDVVRERCYTVQEGRSGTINFPGWRPKVRKTREELKWKGVRECPGFIVQQRRICMGLL